MAGKGLVYLSMTGAAKMSKKPFTIVLLLLISDG
jgi:hypothetical protein